jgi:hypothetical protein
LLWPSPIASYTLENRWEKAISFVFGGYLLGVIAYETKSIWGGIIVHVGIAWMMEAIGFWQKL